MANDQNVHKKTSYSYTNSTISASLTNKADFTPHLIKNNSIKSNNSVIRKLKIPPPPTINKASYPNTVDVNRLNPMISNSKTQNVNNDNYYLSPQLNSKSLRSKFFFKKFSLKNFL